MAYRHNQKAPDDQVLDLLLVEGGWLKRASWGPNPSPSPSPSPALPLPLPLTLPLTLTYPYPYP